MIKRYIFMLLIIFCFYPITNVFADGDDDDDGGGGLKPITLTEKKVLHFGILDAGLGGTINSACSTTSDVISFGGCQDGRFQIKGQKNTQVNVTLINPVPYLSNGSDTASTSYSIVQSPPYILNNKGKRTLKVRGVLTVVDGQDPGFYSGDYDVEVVYTSGGGDDDDDDD